MSESVMEKEKVVFSRSKVYLDGTRALEEAFKLFVPQPKDFTANSDGKIWDFLCSFKHEGFSPVILRSKDVYGYSSCRSVVPDKNVIGVKKVKGLADTKKKAPGLRRERKKKRGRKPKKPNTKGLGPVSNLKETVTNSPCVVSNSPSSVVSDSPKPVVSNSLEIVSNSMCIASNPPIIDSPETISNSPFTALAERLETASISSDSTLSESLETINSLDTGIVYCQMTLEEIWRAATPKIITVKTVVVKDVSCEKNTAAARSRAEKLMHLNLTPHLKLRRLNMP
ncbi:coiled-coil domain-containing protein 71L-like [Acipenser oxyrinchus oxyrinchus]|uniref:Coiled-coil domain-containing protein 71L-like n=1 Tax=Acipenser oxyrinchus oxyrinchus TaxID=40147 RepID=A0AAD8DD43_ACIOX|nr:coiled-coil domain-containing protein 71L-like [Acipenser oxyrinchus oxyrinchus]